MPPPPPGTRSENAPARDAIAAAARSRSDKKVSATRRSLPFGFRGRQELLHCSFDNFAVVVTVEHLGDLAVPVYHNCGGKAFEVVVLRDLLLGNRHGKRDGEFLGEWLHLADSLWCDQGVHRDPDDGDAFFAVLFVEVAQVADLLAARGTPTRKEVQEHGMALEVFQRNGISLYRS